VHLCCCSVENLAILEHLLIHCGFCASTHTLCGCLLPVATKFRCVLTIQLRTNRLLFNGQDFASVCWCLSVLCMCMCELVSLARCCLSKRKTVTLWFYCSVACWLVHIPQKTSSAVVAVTAVPIRVITFLFTKFHMQIITVQITRLLFFDRISPLSTQYCFSSVTSLFFFFISPWISEPANRWLVSILRQLWGML